MEKWLEQRIMTLVDGIKVDIDMLDGNGNGSLHGKGRITALINLEYKCGKYHAFMETLEEISMERFIAYHERYGKTIDQAIGKLEEFYK